MQDVVTTLRRDLQALADEARAAKDKQYLRSELEHIGVNVPSMRRLASAELEARGPIDHDKLWSLVDVLWREPVHELRGVAIEMLLARREVLGDNDLQRVADLIVQSKTWAFVDPLAIVVTGCLVARFDACRDSMDVWSVHDDFWLRRSAMLAWLKPLRAGGGDFDRFAGYADSMLEEKQFFIRKAIGWVLRETSKKRPALVFDWIAPRIARASGVTVREAVKYLPQRGPLMARYRKLNPRGASCRVSHQRKTRERRDVEAAGALRR